jgi:battenin
MVLFEDSLGLRHPVPSSGYRAVPAVSGDDGDDGRASQARPDGEGGNAGDERRLGCCRNGCSFWVLGMLNNFAYVVVLCGAGALADSFGMGKYTGVVPWANVSVGLGVRMLNMCCLETRASARISATGAVFLVGYAMLALSVFHSFWACIVAIVLLGAANSFGESVVLGYLQGFPPAITGAWSSGTGMAGVGGALYYLLLWLLFNGHMNWDCTRTLYTIYASMIPIPILYVAIFRWGPTHWLVGRSSQRDLAAEHPPQQDADQGADAQCADAQADMDAQAPAQAVQGEHAALGGGDQCVHEGGEAEGMERGCGRVLRVGAQVYHTALQLGAVYFFEYVVSVAFAIRAPSAEINGAWWCRNGYQVLQMAYQTGVFLSRSSLGVLRVRRVGILTLLQAANFVGWYLHAVHHVLQSWQQVACMCWVGILGGLMYVNVFANVSPCPHPPHTQPRPNPLNADGTCCDALACGPSSPHHPTPSSASACVRPAPQPCEYVVYMQDVQRSHNLLTTSSFSAPPPPRPPRWHGLMAAEAGR